MSPDQTGSSLVASTLQYIWPILDPRGEQPLTRAEILAHGYPALEQAADECECLIVGHPLWVVQDGAITGGWESWPGRVLIALVPVHHYGMPRDDDGEPMMTRAQWEDLYAMEIAEAHADREALVLRGRQRLAERDQHARRLHQAGLTVPEMQRVLRARFEAVHNALRRCDLTPNPRPRGGSRRTKLGPCLTPNDARIRELCLAGLTLDEISRALDERATVVSAVIVRRGLAPAPARPGPFDGHAEPLALAGAATPIL